MSWSIKLALQRQYPCDSDHCAMGVEHSAMMTSPPFKPFSFSLLSPTAEDQATSGIEFPQILFTRFDRGGQQK